MQQDKQQKNVTEIRIIKVRCSRVTVMFYSYNLYFHVIELRKPYSYSKRYEFSPLEGFAGGNSSIIKISSEDLVQDLFSN